MLSLSFLLAEESSLQACVAVGGHGRDRWGMPWCRYELNGAGKSLERLSMIAGGTGITPMYQVRPVPCTS